MPVHGLIEVGLLGLERARRVHSFKDEVEKQVIRKWFVFLEKKKKKVKICFHGSGNHLIN